LGRVGFKRFGWVYEELMVGKVQGDLWQAKIGVIKR
jgi:hypothetical protein